MTASLATVTADGPRKIGPELHGAARVRHLVARATAAELAGWRSIGRAVAFRPRVPAGASAHGYDKPFRTVLVVFLVLSATPTRSSMRCAPTSRECVTLRENACVRGAKEVLDTSAPES